MDDYVCTYCDHAKTLAHVREFLTDTNRDEDCQSHDVYISSRGLA